MLRRLVALLAVAILIFGASGGGAFARQTQVPVVNLASEDVGPATWATATPAQIVPAAAERALPKVSRASTQVPVEGHPFRPTISGTDYAAAKAAVASLAAQSSRTELAPLAPPVLIPGTFNPGPDQSQCNCLPADPHLAAGGGVAQDVVEVGNSFMAVYDHTGALALQTSLNAFFGAAPPPPFSNTLFDPRVAYDQTWNRWIITADAFPANANSQAFYIGISLTDDALGPFFIYVINATIFAAGDFFDYPQLGLDQDAVLVTANIFAANNSFKFAAAFGIAKARLYNGFGFGIPVFPIGCGTLAPPIVYVADQNPVDYFACARPTGSTIPLFAMREPERPGSTTMVLQANVAVPAYTVPPNASQSGTTAQIDTLDARFVNSSTQIGNQLYQIHSIAFGPAALRWYLINTATNVATNQTFFTSGSSADWNGSIAANASGEVFVTWSWNDAPAGIQVGMRASGRQGADAIGPGIALDNSPTFYTGGRWGDYSAISLDPVGTATCAPNRRAWLANEEDSNTDALGNPVPTFWVTNIAQVGFCQ